MKHCLNLSNIHCDKTNKKFKNQDDLVGKTCWQFLGSPLRLEGSDQFPLTGRLVHIARCPTVGVQFIAPKTHHPPKTLINIKIRPFVPSSLCCPQLRFFTFSISLPIIVLLLELPHSSSNINKSWKHQVNG